MPITPEMKKRIETALSFPRSDEERKKFLTSLQSKGVTSLDVPELAEIAPAQSGNFSFGGSLGALGSGFVEGATGLNPEQAATSTIKGLGGQQKVPQAESGLNVDVPFLGQVDPVRAAGQAAGAVVSPFNKIKLVGRAGMETVNFLARNFGPSAVQALQGITNPDGDIGFQDVATLFGVDTATALFGKILPKIQGAASFRGIGGEYSPPKAQRPISPEPQRQLSQGKPVAGLLPEHAPIPMPQNLQRPIRLPETQQGVQPGTARGESLQFLPEEPRMAPQAPSGIPPQPIRQSNILPEEPRFVKPPSGAELSLSEERAALQRMKATPKTEVRQSPTPPKSKTITSSQLMKGDQFVDENGRLMEVIDRPKGRKQPLKVRDLQTGKVKTLARSDEKQIQKIYDIQLENLDFLFGEK